MSNLKSDINHQKSQIFTVGIIGSGAMGSGIAQVAATSGCKVNIFDTNQTALDTVQ